MGLSSDRKKIMSKNLKTYSKYKSHVNENKASSAQRRINRKPVPKFEELFLHGNGKDLSLNDSLYIIEETERRKSDIQSDSSSDFVPSLNDTFDAIANHQKSSEPKKTEKKPKGLSLHVISSSSESSETDVFFSPFSLQTHGMTASVQLRPHNKQEKYCAISSRNQPNTHISPDTEQEPSAVEGTMSDGEVVQRKKNLRTHPSVNIITSTPAVTMRNKDPALRARRSILDEFSPVTKNTSLMLDISSNSDESNSYNFHSCPSSFPEKNYTKASLLTEKNNTTDEKSTQFKLKQCSVLLSKLNLDPGSSSVTNNECNLGSTLFTQSASSDKNNQEQIAKSIPFSPISPANSFRKITRRRRICPPPYGFIKENKRPSIFWITKSSIKDKSMFYQNHTGNNSSHFNNTSLRSVNALNKSSSSFTVKAGKGWRRSVKKLSCRRNIELQNSVSCVEETLDKSSILLCDSLPEEEDDERAYILKLCGQEEEMSFASYIDRPGVCKKIGEGVYGEVFMWDSKETTAPTNSCCVIKIMPIEGDFSVNGEPQKSFKEIAAEVVVSKALSDLREGNFTDSFMRMDRCGCVRGVYPPTLLECWDFYAENKESENDRPDIFPENQLHIILEAGFAGQNVESYVFNNAMQAYHSFLQVAYALAVAEEQLEFEHRDLHWGNVLIIPTSESSIDYIIRKHPVKLKTCGVRATIIDFSLSRLCVNGNTYFNDLAKDPSLFTAEGDYQFDIYRMMQKTNGNSWREFHPITNIYWLHYLLLKLANDCYYKNKSTRVHREGMAKLRSITKKVMSFSSATTLMCQLENVDIGI